MEKEERSEERGELFILSAPSGTGKNTLIREVLAIFGESGGLVYSVSYTTRPPREGEIYGQNYYFIDQSEFDRMITNEEFLESAEYNSHRYGTAASEVLPRLDAGLDVIIEIEVRGTELLMQRCPKAHAIFLLPPSYRDLKGRIEKRGIDGPVDVTNRLTLAQWEIGRYGLYQYAIINDDLECASQALAAIILEKRQRLARQEGRIEKVLEDFGRFASDP